MLKRDMSPIFVCRLVGATVFAVDDDDDGWTRWGGCCCFGVGVTGRFAKASDCEPPPLVGTV